MDVLIEFWRDFVSRPDFWAMMTLPPVTAIVTWAHVWMALKMLFYPVHFVGMRVSWFPESLQGLGWQGIVPRKAGKISGIIVDQTLTKLGSLEEFFTAMEPVEMADMISSELNKSLEHLIDEVMMDRRPVLWQNLPFAIKRRIYKQAHEQLPSTLRGLVTDLTYQVEDLVDMREMVVSRMENDRELMVNMFLKVGQKEINFIWHISALIGLFFGVVQMFVYLLVPEEWRHASVPLFAAIWGFLTNMLAIKMVFEPVEPHYYRYPKFFSLSKKAPFIHLEKPHIGTYNWQGAFMKRQTQVSEVFAQIVVEELVTVQNIMNEMMYGKHKDKTRRVIKTHIHRLLDTPVVRTTLQMSLGPKDYAQLKTDLIDKSIDATMEPINDPELNANRAQKIVGLFTQRIQELTPKEFENLLRPAFREDETTLIVLGAITGALAGLIHLLTVFV